MEYRYKRELEKEYKVEASFYYRDIDEEKILCRRVADVKKEGHDDAKIDAYFILMNPGSCKIYDASIVAKDESGEIIMAESKPDATMVRIMNIMQELDFKHIRILNMSDVVSGNSAKAEASIDKLIERGYDEHCIFSEKRREELKELTKEEAVYVAAWGCSDKISYYSPYAMEYFKDKKLVGVYNGVGKYKHIKPPNKNLQIALAEQIIEQIKNIEK